MIGSNLQRIEQLSSLMEQIKEQRIFNGVILVAEQGQPLICESIGIAKFNDTGNSLLTTNSIFEIASVSKPITALGIIKLQQQGYLQWEDEISKWLPQLPYPNITIRHLLCHTSGLPDYIELFAREWDPTKYATNEDVLQMLILHQPEPPFAPNEGWMYSNTGYIILAILIEKISGRTYANFLSEEIFQPLEMKRTKVYNRRIDPDALPEDYAFGYVYRLDPKGYILPDELPELNYVLYLDGLQGDGMVNSTVGELLKLDVALNDDSFIAPELRQTMFTPVQMNDGETFGYGFGWLIEQDEKLGNLVWHSGGWPGYSTMFKRYLDQKATLIILQNGERKHAYTEQIIQGIEQILAGEAYEIPQPFAEPNIIPLLPQDYEPHIGKYRFKDEQNNTVDAEVYVIQEKLYMKLSNGMILSLLPISSTRYYEQQTATELEFTEIHDGTSNRLIWSEQGVTNIAERIQ